MSHAETYDFVIKQNDTAPSITATLQQGGVDFDLTDASVKFIMRERGTSDTPKVDSNATITDEPGGEVAYAWLAADTDTVGVYEGEFEVTNSDNTVTTFPDDNYITILVTDDLA